MLQSNFTLGMVAAAAAMALPGTASAAEWVVDTSGGSQTQIINFNAVGSGSDGLSASLTMAFLGATVEGTNTIYSFSYLMDNTSDMITQASSRVSIFGFKVNPFVSGASSTGVYELAAFSADGFNQPNSVADVQVCFKNTGGTNSCSGSGGGVGIDMAADDSDGVFKLIYSAPVGQLTLSDFAVRYQSTGLDGEGSASGTGSDGNPNEPPPAVPEPATWMMMLLGFGLVGASMRYRKGTAFRAQFA